MHATRGELEWSLDDLKGRLPKLRRDHVAEEDFWAVFHAYADPIVEDAAPDDAPYAHDRIRSMLTDNDLDCAHFTGIEPERQRHESD